MKKTIASAEIETLEKLKSLPLETDEDFRKLGGIFDEDE